MTTLHGFFLFGLLSTVCWLRGSPVPVTIDRQASSVSIKVKSTMDSFTVTVGAYQTKVIADPGEGAVLSADFEFDFLSLKTGNEDRDKQMQSWQNTAAFPTCIFHLLSLDSTTSTAKERRAKGTFTLHGVTREISFPIILETAPAAWSCAGETVIDTRDFGLPVIRKFLLLKVDPLVRVQFHFQGSAAQP